VDTGVAMATSLIEISISGTQPEGSRVRALRARAADAGGRPVRGAVVEFQLTGDGTFDPGEHRTTIASATDAKGEAWATWWEFPRYNPRLPVLQAAITASCEPAARLTLEDANAIGPYSINPLEL
jgi:hypothetical protein